MAEFGVNKRMLKALEPCMNTYGSGNPELYEWPNNVLSTKTVVFEDGSITRGGTASTRNVDPSELARCKALSAELHKLVSTVHVGMKSEGDDGWKPFFQAAAIGAPVPKTLDEAAVRSIFGGTIMPLDRIVVEPLQEAGSWWKDLQSSEDEATDAAWRKLMAFVAANRALHGAVFVQIGFYEYGETIDFEGEPPDGYEMRGSCLPRLALAITDKGSVVGVFGHVVWT
jgi:hypothetical protein